MQPFAYALLFLGAFAGGFVAGLAGFGTALMALGIWLYVLPPSDAVPLILICSVVAQSWTLPSLWRSFDFTLIWPFVIGGLVGVFLLLFPLALYFSKPMAFRFGGRPADAAIGLAGGVLGALAGLSGPLPILWATIRGWGKDERRGIFQTYNWAVLFAALCLQAASGLIAGHVMWLALLAFPGTILGAWQGARCYHAMSDRNFRDVVLSLLFLSGVALVWTTLGAH